MYRFLLSPKWLGFHLVVVAGILVMVNLAFWQLDRLDARRDFNSVVLDRADLPSNDIDQLLLGDDKVGDPRLEEIEWRQATTTGEYLPGLQFTVINRSQNGRAGANVVTPLQLADGRILLVNRGFVPLGFGFPDAPSGPVDVRGLLRVSQQRRTGQLSDPLEGVLTELQRLDIDRIATQTPGVVLPMYLQLLISNPPETPGFPEPVIRPDLSEGSHLSYAVQWLIFATAVAAGWVLAIRRSVQQRKKSSQDGGTGFITSDAETSDSPSSASSGFDQMRP
jgi:cytochrome oxidase assembly protein ShyY1